MKTKSLLLLIVTMLTQSSFGQNLCEYVIQNNFEEIEEIFKHKVNEIRHDKTNFKNNSERLDSLEKWMQSYPCIQDAYWNKNDMFTLNTARFINRLAVKFIQNGKVVEKCFAVQTYYHNYTRKLSRKDRRLLYKGLYACEGFIELRRTMDSSNYARGKVDRHNSLITLTLGLEPLPRPKSPFMIHAYEEGQSIRVRLNIENRTDTVQKVVWPIYQNDGKKIIYFELLDEQGNHLFTEHRGVGLTHNETISWDILTLQPLEKKTFTHTINGFCIADQKRIECHHFIGLLQEGNYKLKAWYDPFVGDVHKEVWQPIGRDSVLFRYEPSIDIIRTRKYAKEQHNLRYKDTVLVEDKSQSIFKVKLIGGKGDYYSRLAIGHYDAIGVIKEVKKGFNSIGDTVAIAFRYTGPDSLVYEKIRSNIEAKKLGTYWIYATNSTALYYQIQQVAGTNRFLKGKRNFQLINHKNAMVEHLPLDTSASKVDNKPLALPIDLFSWKTKDTIKDSTSVLCDMLENDMFLLEKAIEQAIKEINETAGTDRLILLSNWLLTKPCIIALKREEILTSFPGKTGINIKYLTNNKTMVIRLSLIIGKRKSGKEDYEYIEMNGLSNINYNKE
jgi:hypothetical protein